MREVKNSSPGQRLVKRQGEPRKPVFEPGFDPGFADHRGVLEFHQLKKQLGPQMEVQQRAADRAPVGFEKKFDAGLPDTARADAVCREGIVHVAGQKIHHIVNGRLCLAVGEVQAADGSFAENQVAAVKVAMREHTAARAALELVRLAAELFQKCGVVFRLGVNIFAGTQLVKLLENPVHPDLSRLGRPKLVKVVQPSAGTPEDLVGLSLRLGVAQNIRGRPALGKPGDVKAFVCAQIHRFNDFAALCGSEMRAELLKAAEFALDPRRPGFEIFFQHEDPAAFMHKRKHHLLPPRIFGLVHAGHAKAASHARGRLELLQVALDHGLVKFRK
nr:hypothetical protein [Leisingera thetidis]